MDDVWVVSDDVEKQHFAVVAQELFLWLDAAAT